MQKIEFDRTAFEWAYFFAITKGFGCLARWPRGI
jgi:hypothetical protein